MAALMSINLFIVDAFSLFRAGLGVLLEKKGEFKVLGDTGNGRKAVELVDKLAPDVVLVSISLPEIDGVEVTRRIAEKHKNTRILGLARRNDKDAVSSMLRAGASGFLSQNCHIEELTLAIRSVCDGMCYLSPEVASIVINDFRLIKEETINSPAISKREHEVLQLIAEGYSSKEIADKLNLSFRTITSHRQNIMLKLNCHDIVSLTKYAIRKGIISSEQ